jgi:hypothetical protein
VKADRAFWTFVTLSVMAVYVSVSFAVFRLRHPAATETQLMLHTVDAMLWRQVESLKR